MNPITLEALAFAAVALVAVVLFYRHGMRRWDAMTLAEQDADIVDRAL